MKMDKQDTTRQYRTIRTTAPTTLLRASAITMVMLCMAAFVCGTAGAATIWVPEGGNQTIQQAVNNATGGDTIIVRDGTYSENVNVNKAHLTIRSENGSDSTTVQAQSTSDHVFYVNADYVNISGFTATGAGWWSAGIRLSNGDHCNISDNNVSSNFYGILLSSSSNNTLTENNVTNDGYGIYLSSSSNNSLSNNTANSNDDRGIYLSASSNNNTLAGNTANSNSYYGIYLSSSSNNALTSNTVDSNTADGIRLESSSNYNTLTNNIANSNDWNGIRLCNSNNYNNITDNTANSNDWNGICLESSSDNNVSCNWVQNNTDAGFYLSGGSTGNTIESNNIIVNGVLQGDGSYQWQFNNDQDNAVDAKNNYWGAGMNDTLIDASINENSGTVTFLPKRDGKSPCAPVPELPTVLLLAVGLALLAGYVRVGRRK